MTPLSEQGSDLRVLHENSEFPERISRQTIVPLSLVVWGLGLARLLFLIPLALAVTVKYPGKTYLRLASFNPACFYATPACIPCTRLL